MIVNEKRIKRIIFSIDENDFNDDILNISIIFKEDRHLIKLTKTNTLNNVNVYDNSCIIPWDGKGLL